MNKSILVLFVAAVCLLGMAAQAMVWAEWSDFAYRECVREARREKAPMVICENLQIVAEDFFTHHVATFATLMKKDHVYYDELLERSMEPSNRMQGEAGLRKVIEVAVSKRVTSEKKMKMLFQREVAQWFMNVCTGKDAPTIGPTITKPVEKPDLSNLPPEVQAQLAGRFGN